MSSISYYVQVSQNVNFEDVTNPARNFAILLLRITNPLKICTFQQCFNLSRMLHMSHVTLSHISTSDTNQEVYTFDISKLPPGYITITIGAIQNVLNSVVILN